MNSVSLEFGFPGAWTSGNSVFQELGLPGTWFPGNRVFRELDFWETQSSGILGRPGTRSPRNSDFLGIPRQTQWERRAAFVKKNNGLNIGRRLSICSVEMPKNSIIHDKAFWKGPSLLRQKSLSYAPKILSTLLLCLSKSCFPQLYTRNYHIGTIKVSCHRRFLMNNISVYFTKQLLPAKFLIVWHKWSHPFKRVIFRTLLFPSTFYILNFKC